MTENVLFHFVNTPECMRNKEEVIYSLKRYLKTCEDVEDTWSQIRRSEVLKTISGLLKKVLKMDLPEVHGLGWSYAYFFESDGMYLRLLHNTEFEINEDDESSDCCIKENFALVKEPYEYLGVKDYAELYEVNEVTVRQWIRRGKLRSAVKRGGEWFIPSVADRPKRGYAAVRYEWDSDVVDLLDRFPYLSGCKSLSIQQNTTDKRMFVVSLYSESRFPERIQVLTAEREKLELALIEHPDVKGEAWYDMGITYPSKAKNVVLKGGVLKMANVNAIPEENVMENDEQLEFEVKSSRSDCYDIMTWYFSAKLVTSRVDEDKEETETVVELDGGMVVPSSTEVEEKGFDDLSDFGDSVSGDLWEVCKALSDKKNGGLKEKILQEIDEEWIDSCVESFMYVQDISCIDIKYLEIFLRDFDEYKQGLPGIDYCQLVAVLLKWDTEKEKVKAFVDAGWRLLTLDSEECIIAYRGRTITA